MISQDAGNVRSISGELEGWEIEIKVWPGYAVGDVKAEVVINIRDGHGTFLDANNSVLNFGGIALDPRTQLIDHDISAAAQLRALLVWQE